MLNLNLISVLSDRLYLDVYTKNPNIENEWSSSREKLILRPKFLDLSFFSKIKTSSLVTPYYSLAYPKDICSTSHYICNTPKR